MHAAALAQAILKQAACAKSLQTTETQAKRPRQCRPTQHGGGEAGSSDVSQTEPAHAERDFISLCAVCEARNSRFSKRKRRVIYPSSIQKPTPQGAGSVGKGLGSLRKWF